MEEIGAGPELPHVTLYLALIRFERFEWAVEKATELGVTRIVPVEAARSERGLVRGRAEADGTVAADCARGERAIAAPARAGSGGCAEISRRR